MDLRIEPDLEETDGRDHVVGTARLLNMWSVVLVGTFQKMFGHLGKNFGDIVGRKLSPILR